MIDFGVLNKNTPYVYKIKAIDNQLQQTILTGSLQVPDIKIASNSTGTLVSSTTDTIVYAHVNRTISGSLSLSGSTSILLANNSTGSTSSTVARNGISLTMGTGVTRVESLVSSSGALIWNGGFILGEMVDTGSFIGSGAITHTGALVSNMNIEKIIKVGADTLGVQMNLNQPVVLSVS